MTDQDGGRDRRQRHDGQLPEIAPATQSGQAERPDELHGHQAEDDQREHFGHAAFDQQRDRLSKRSWRRADLRPVVMPQRR